MIEQSAVAIADIGALTYNNGRFELDLPAAGEHCLRLLAEGYVTKVVTVSVSESGGEIELAMNAKSD
ncbi:MAG: hypothetical protein AAGA95_21930 [Pseudomonadota bacterium]